MNVKREDLVAAANAGVLHYKEVDSLLIFLAQREVTTRKTGDAAEPGRRRPWLSYYLAGILAIAVATVCGYFLISRSVLELGMFTAGWFTIIYALSSIGSAAWLGIRNGGIVRGIFSVFLVALMPLAIVAAQQMMRLVL